MDVSARATTGTVHAAGPGLILLGVRDLPLVPVPATVTADAMGKADAPQPPFEQTYSYPNPDGTTTTVNFSSTDNAVTGGRIRVDAESDVPGFAGCAVTVGADEGTLSQTQTDVHVQ